MPLVPMLLGATMPVPTPLERAVLDAINAARADPAAYAESLKTYRGYFDGKIVRYPGNPTGLITEEGVAAVDEAIAFLRVQPALLPITYSDLLALAASDHVREQGPRGATGHESADGTRPGGRVIRRGGGQYVAETITYGPPSAAEVVRQLIVDDGVKSRGHRRILYAAEYRYAGVGCGPHAKYGAMCVVDYGRTRDGQP